MIQEAEGETALHHYEELFEQWKESEFDILVDDAQEHAEEVERDYIVEQISETIGRTVFEAHDVLELLTGSDGLLTDDEKSQFWNWVMSVSQRMQAEREARRNKRRSA